MSKTDARGLGRASSFEAKGCVCSRHTACCVLSIRCTKSCSLQSLVQMFAGLRYFSILHYIIQQINRSNVLRLVKILFITQKTCLTSGVPQGFILGPQWFVYMCTDIYSIIYKHNIYYHCYVCYVTLKNCHQDKNHHLSSYLLHLKFWTSQILQLNANRT